MWRVFGPFRFDSRQKFELSKWISDSCRYKFVNYINSRYKGHSRWRPSVKPRITQTDRSILFGNGSARETSMTKREDYRVHWRICSTAVNRQLTIGNGKMRRLADCKTWRSESSTMLSLRVNEVRETSPRSATYKSSTAISLHHWEDEAIIYVSSWSSIVAFARFVV